MGINKNQLEINVNLHALQPDFLNSEVYYVIAQSENSFRFAAWNDAPQANEEKFYAFLTEDELLIPAGNILLKESYRLTKEPVYPVVSNAADFVSAIDTLQKDSPAKGVRQFYDEDIDTIKQDLEKRYEKVEKHLVTSRQGRHLLISINDIEVSISAAMVYFRYKTVFSQSHYDHIMQQGKL